ncbi:RNA-guided pseudouridylation complex pseudouridine synthase subunit Cbf5 [Candidatus Woesearchaeota archaeon]|nr:MAG: RNA-guided pseudouridylation complex pseudouridine synthase subunit Cbf5 [Candidatus Woesearchaeota archaeon]
MKEMFPFEEWDRSILVKRNAVAQEGIPPEDRPTEVILNYGIINVDKPSGPTSHMVSAYVKQILGIEKCGHSGTLDPKVTGVLPVALGRASRIVQALLPAGKEYVALMHIHKDVPKTKIKAVMQEFVGEIKQLPPVKSAVKRRERKRTVYYLNIIEIDGRDVLFRVGCQAGTYVRKLCYDIGQRLGVGAHMQELRRTRVANFDESTAFTLHDIRDAFYYYKKGNHKFIRKVIQPVERAVEHLPKVWALDSAVLSMSHGRDLAVPGVAKLEACVKKGALVAVMTLKNELVGLGYAQMTPEEVMDSSTGIVVNLHKVFIHHARVKI